MKALKKPLSLLMALLMCFGVFAGTGVTAFAAGETMTTYMVDIPRASDPNKAGWGHPAFNFLGGWSTGAADHFSVHTQDSFTGKAIYSSGDAAEQVVRMSLEGAEFALKISGSAAKNLAAALYTVLKDQKKTKGKARIETMLREKRPMTVYTIKKEDAPEFARQAKGYGILYAPIPVKKDDNTIDILVFEDDAARANRIVEKFNLTVVDTASIKEDIQKSREQRGSEPAAPEQAAPEKSQDDKLLDELMEKPAQKEKAEPEHPAAEKTDSFTPAAEKSHPSAPISESSRKSARGTSDGPEKPSVRQELRDIQAQRKKEAEVTKAEEPSVSKKPAQKTTRHQPPKPKKKPKSKER